MPNYRCARIGGGTYFFTVNTLNRQTFLLDNDVRAALREGIARVRQSWSFTVNQHVAEGVYSPDWGIVASASDEGDFGEPREKIRRAIRAPRCRG